VVEPDDGTVLLSNAGEPFSLDHLSDLVRVHVHGGLSVDGKPARRGACHLFRDRRPDELSQGPSHGSGGDRRFDHGV
jgi:integrase/recombinase XerD